MRWPVFTLRILVPLLPRSHGALKRLSVARSCEAVWTQMTLPWPPGCAPANSFGRGHHGSKASRSTNPAWNWHRDTDRDGSPSDRAESVLRLVGCPVLQTVA